MTLSPTALEEAAKQLDPDAWDFNAPGADDRREDARIMATAAITAYLAQMEKEGRVMVPREATAVQAKAGVDADDMRTGFEAVKTIYRAMLAAVQNGGEG